jgi:hypothetical protein
MVNSAQPGEGGGCTRPPPFTPSTITSKVVVYAPAERADTLLLFLLYRILFCFVFERHRYEKRDGSSAYSLRVSRSTLLKQGRMGGGAWGERAKIRNYSFSLEVEKKYFARSSAVVWGWAELLFMALIVQIVSRWDCTEILLYLCPHYVLFISLVMANEKGSSLQIHSIQPSALCCSTQRRMRLNREGATQGKAQVEGP